MANQMRADALRVVEPGDDDTQYLPAKRTVQNLAIEVTNATLQYPIGPVGQGSLKSKLFELFGHREGKPKFEYVEALKNVSFTISHGERVGIIGRNGSGKSTILRTLAGVYPLKTGSVRVVGRISTLLELGLGFETEATGRENIYYRGMAMGYSPKEMKAVEREIVEFAQLGEFIDLPMRTYSSGMFVRLGFAISTQIDPDVLLIDEVFGAGDSAFSKRAIQRMNRMVRRAGILVIATHDTGLIERLCTRVLWLGNGEIIRDGPPEIVIPQFAQFMSEQT